jgi:hypothetical protein
VFTFIVCSRKTRKVPEKAKLKSVFWFKQKKEVLFIKWFPLRPLRTLVSVANGREKMILDQV